MKGGRRMEVQKLADIDQINDDVERLIILRKRLNKSQYEFARLLGISPSYIGQIENYKVPFTKKMRDRIDEYLRQEQALHEKDIFSNIR